MINILISNVVQMQIWIEKDKVQKDLFYNLSITWLLTTYFCIETLQFTHTWFWRIGFGFLFVFFVLSALGAIEFKRTFLFKAVGVKELQHSPFSKLRKRPKDKGRLNLKSSKWLKQLDPSVSPNC